jgi:hypothetical protein
MDATRLLSAIEAAEESAYGRLNDDLSAEREASINAYLGKPYGNEVEGQSQIVSRDVMDTIEWIKPSLVRIFTGGDELIRFEPVGPEDEEGSKQETDYVNYIVQQKNDWFHVFWNWSTDALLTKNAYAFAYWDEKNDTTKERYQGLTEDQLALIMQDETAEIVSKNEIPGPNGIAYDVEVQKKKNYGCVKIEVLPPERCLVAESTSGVSVRSSDFFEYWEIKSISALREMGFDVADDISDTDGGPDFSIEDSARDQYGERSAPELQASDPAMRKVRVRMCWVKHDYNEDGLAEHVQVALVGKTILKKKDDEENKTGVYEVSGVPVACMVPTPMPHRHPGLSVADMVADIQYYKTAIEREILNNLSATNRPRTAISDKVNLDDMLTSRVNGIVRVEGPPGQHVLPMVVPFMGPQALQIIEHLDQTKENRTGTNRYFSGTDQGSLNKTATGIAQLTSSAAQRVEMIARVFAEGVKELFHIVHELTLKHARQGEIVRLRNQWVPVDPREWKKRTDLTIAVGLGTGNKEVVAANLMNVMKTQFPLAQLGLIGPEGMVEAAKQLTKAYGFANPDQFFPDPKPGQMPNPEQLQQAMQQLQQMQEKVQQDAQGVEQGKLEIERGKLDLEKQSVALDAKQVKLDATREVAMSKLDAKEQKIGMAAESKGLTSEGEDVAQQQLQAVLQGLEALMQGMQQLAQLMAAPKVLRKGPNGEKMAVPLIQ